MKSSKPIRLLIVEDHFLARLAVATLVTDQTDMEVVAQAETGRQALDLYREHKPDLVLMDLRLPEMDGVAATEGLCRETPPARVLILSHYESDVDVAAALKAGARGYLRKDVAGTILLDAIRRVAEGQRYVPQDLAHRLANRDPESPLTARELDILRGIFAGKSNKEIGDDLKISDGTVRIHVSNILLKLGVKRRTEAVAVGLKQGLLKSEP